MSTTIRVSEETRSRIAVLSASTGRPMTDVVEAAVEALERRVFFDNLNARYGKLRADADAWSEVEAERAAEESAARDASG